MSTWTEIYTKWSWGLYKLPSTFMLCTSFDPGKKHVWKSIIPILILQMRRLWELKYLAWGICIPIPYTLYYAISLTVSKAF